MTCVFGALSCSISEICRICLQKENVLINIFLPSPENEPTAASLILTFGNTPVDEQDGFPSQICTSCELQLRQCNTFRQNIQRNYEILCSSISNEVSNEEKPNVSYEEHTPAYFELPLDITNSIIKKEESMDEGSDFGLPDMNDESSSDRYTKRRTTRSSKSSKKEHSAKKKLKKEAKKLTRRKKSEPKKLPDQNDKLSAALQKFLKNRDKCPLCFETLQENETMETHFYSHYNHSILTPLIVNGKKTATCNICERDYKFFNMVPHHRKHLKIYPFKCEFEGCDKAFASTMNLSWHLDTHNGIKKYQCKTCGKTFGLSGSLRNHEETHIIENAQCKICNKTYKNHQMLKLHIKRHINSERYKCEQAGCDRGFYSIQELNRHHRTHFGTRTFICDVCSKAWYTEKELIRHKKYHDPVKAHQCGECLKTFVDKSQLKFHVMTHRGERPHVCEYCTTAFITRSKLKRHQMKSCKGSKNILMIEHPPQVNIV